MRYHACIMYRLRPIRYRSEKQRRQDKWVVERVFKGKTGGYFLDIGAADGLSSSNTWVLEKHFGWTGICVEPQNAFFEELAAVRSCRCVKACLSAAPEVVAFRNSSWYGGIVKYLETQPVHKRSMWEAGEIVELQTITIGELLQDYGAPRIIDYASIDVEGSESAILSVFPFARYTIRALSVETSDSVLEDLLVSKGYRPVENPFCRAEEELFFLHESFQPG